MTVGKVPESPNTNTGSEAWLRTTKVKTNNYDIKLYDLR